MHELSLIVVPHDAVYGPRLVPYCRCGWTGTPVPAADPEAASSAFQAHLEET